MQAGPAALKPAGVVGSPEATKIAIELKGITRSFGRGERRVEAVRGIDLTIRQGEIVALLGPNGAGKTTTIDMLLGLTDPDSGTVRVLGDSPRDAVRSGMLSALLQTGGLLSDLTVAETVEVIASFHSATKRVPEVMQRTDLQEIAHRHVGKCSGGEQQRVKFALALLPDPDVLVLDEPTAGMDVNARRRFWEAMHQEADTGRTIVFATHYLEEAERFAQRTVVMNRGKIVADGTTFALRGSLNGRTVTATLPPDGGRGILDKITSSALLREARESDIEIEGTTVRVRTSNSDALAAMLLDFGAFDLLITAPTLESAFETLTEN